MFLEVLIFIYLFIYLFIVFKVRRKKHIFCNAVLQLLRFFSWKSISIDCQDTVNISV